MTLSLNKIDIRSFCKAHRKALITTAFLILIVILILLIPAFAINEKGMEDKCKGMIDVIFSGGLTDSVKDIVLANPATKYSAAWNIMVNVYKTVLLPIGFALLSLHLVIGIVQQSIKLDQLTAQQFLKPFLLFIVGFMVVKNGLTILCYMINIAQGIVNEMTIGSEAAMSTMIAKANLLVENEVDGMITGFVLMIQLFLPWAAALILGVAVKVVCYTRIFELYLKTMLAPLGMCDVVTKGLDSNGLRFFKNYLATCLQGVVIVGISIIYSSILGSVISGSTETTILGMAGTALVMGFAALSMMMKAGSITKEVLGA
jgi:hypothetical protein